MFLCVPLLSLWPPGRAAYVTSRQGLPDCPKAAPRCPKEVSNKPPERQIREAFMVDTRVLPWIPIYVAFEFGHVVAIKSSLA